MRLTRTARSKQYIAYITMTLFCKRGTSLKKTSVRTVEYEEPNIEQRGEGAWLRGLRRAEGWKGGEEG